MFHRDVYDFFPELVRGDPQVLSYFGRKYFPHNWYLQLFSADRQAPHIDEENPYMEIRSSGEDMPLEVFERFIAGIPGRRNICYSVAYGRERNIQAGNWDIKIDTYVISEDGTPIMEIGYTNKAFGISLIATHLANFYTDHDLLKAAANILSIPKLMEDNPPLSNRVLKDLDEAIANAGLEAFQQTAPPQAA